ncbi:MAG: DHHA1 domain-containing protein, partial [Bacilli bacterium]|nr:DHHA1 domain-containing protein [Bacilli bacterium]
FVKVNKGELKVGDVVTVSVDLKKRRLIERNHSATHLMHSALMNVLGEHVKQMGSYVDENYLRFDFMSNRKLSEQEIASINDEVNEKIVESIPEVTEILPIEEAKNRGAEMEFSEKYGKVVRVVEFGEYSREFCGGTHVKNSADIGLFIIESEDAVASGVRRITARTSLGAYQYLSKRVNNLNKAESLLGASDVDVISHISSLQSNNQSLNKELSETKQKLASLDAKSLSGSGEKIDGHEVFITYKEGASREDLLQISDSLKSNRQDYVIVLLGGKEGARPLVCFVGGESLQKVSAGNIVKLLAKELGGGGGGKNEMATGQLKKGDNFINLAHNILKESL